jgi:hypothetical protein
MSVLSLQLYILAITFHKKCTDLLIESAYVQTKCANRFEVYEYVYVLSAIIYAIYVRHVALLMPVKHLTS